MLNDSAKDMPGRGPTTSRHVVINDKECKTRLVAEIDYHSQNALAPFEKYMKDCIQNGNNVYFKEAYNQTGSFERINKTIKKTGCARSSDLKSATDYLQIALQNILVERIMKNATGKDGFGDIWETINTERDFVLEGSNETYRYAQGQPMGTKGS
jgi:hypothetical protein